MVFEPPLHRESSQQQRTHCSRNPTYNGVFRLLEQLFGEKSQDEENKEQRLETFINGNSVLGTEFKETCQHVINECPNAENGPLSMTPANIRLTRKSGKLQHEMTEQIEKHRAKQLSSRYDALPNDDRRRLFFINRQP